MGSMIIGTAGHVDHGKTTLIEKLTGTDTDRLKEEKKRGITIELGFARFETPEGEFIGIVDVPGHEKFLHNMLAGMGGIDLALLVIAADEGIMPQTKEHLDIIKSLAIPLGMVVITKKDLVEEEWLEMVEEEVKEAVKDTVFSRVEPLAVSSHTGENMEVLKERIVALSHEIAEKNEDRRSFRLPIDRVFTIDGFGTVVTGTLKEGCVKKGDVMEIYPNGETVKVRTLQVHGQEVDRAVAGQRTAINVTGLKRGPIQRGQVLAHPGTMEITSMVDVLIDVFPQSPRDILNGSRVHFHYGTHQTIAKVVLLDQEQLGPGQQGYAQLRLEEKIALKKGDPIILRFLSPTQTIAGGRVLDPFPPKHKRYQDRILQSLTIKNQGSPLEILEQIIKDREPSLAFPELLMGKSSFSQEAVEEGLQSLLAEEKIIALGDRFCHRDYDQRLEEKIKGILADYHGRFPLSRGMDKAEMQSKIEELFFGQDSRGAQNVLAHFLKKGVFIEREGILCEKDFSLQLSEEQEREKKAIWDHYRREGFAVPALKELEDYSKEAPELVSLLEKEGKLIKLNRDYFMEKETYKEGVAFVQKQIREQGQLLLATMRDHTQTSRKYTLIFLEALDDQKLTRLEGEGRIWIGK